MGNIKTVKGKINIFFPIIIGIIFGLLTIVYFYKIPCGGCKKGICVDGTCSYGPILFQNIQQGHFFLPFGYN